MESHQCSLVIISTELCQEFNLKVTRTTRGKQEDTLSPSLTPSLSSSLLVEKTQGLDGKMALTWEFYDFFFSNLKCYSYFHSEEGSGGDYFQGILTIRTTRCTKTSVFILLVSSVQQCLILFTSPESPKPLEPPTL